ncbi:DUF624 domain-containing protein [Salibacterium salarium]|uniref:DUF624 domain-containing protein n=1 Tax=Salibacterium salarium TaxID=284579 RepID=A0A428NA66_9BACI|nr:DUF624 domain-containing protein [Salibacterium salarium]RSL35231.1 DUF624 domain-containing protein [Salibacterium salarium]
MFDNSGVVGGFYRAGETVLFLVYVNVLWILFSFLGLIIFGLGPSTLAMFTVFRRWAMGAPDVRVFTTFWQAFRADFVKANALAWLLFVFGLMIYTNLNYFTLPSEWLHLIFRYVIIGAALLYGAMLLYIFPVMAHYETNFFRYFKNAVLIAVFQPLRTVYLIAACFTLYHCFIPYLYYYYFLEQA